MATISAVLPPTLIEKIVDAVDPDETAETAIECAIQVTLPTAKVTYSARDASVTVTLPDDEIITALLNIALLEQGSTEPGEAAVSPDTLQAADARHGFDSSQSPLL